MEFKQKPDIKKPIYCDDVPFELLRWNRDDIQPENVLDDPAVASKVKEAIDLVTQYIEFVEEEVTTS